MGAWGHGPFDNDTALDWKHDPVTPESLRRALSSDDDDLVLVAAATIVDSRTPIDEQTKALAAQRVRAVCLSYDCVSCWDDPEGRKEVVEGVLRYLA